MITMTYDAAMDIQETQLLFYTRQIGDMGKAYARDWFLSRTMPCPGAKDVPMGIREINKLVPRGGDFENNKFCFMLVMFRNHHNVPFVSGI